MSSITLKLSSLVIKTLSKPIANQLKAQAREHKRFRRLCISFAQSIHRIDMRLRLGLLQDPAAQERAAAKEAAEAQVKRNKIEILTVKTEQETNIDETTIEKEKSKSGDKPKPHSKPRIRPLSEAKAIDSGANFISETFLFLVGGSLIVFESFRSRRKEHTRREDISDRLTELEENERKAREALVVLEKELMQIRSENLSLKAVSKQNRILPKEYWNQSQKGEREDEPKKPGWFQLLGTKFRRGNESSALSSSSQDDEVLSQL
ncbi:MAG: hypothetical protein M1829_001391 [Trizodia sp. TS-e1964]|nr:MAG: hypothetical protein M1829_001391 [Trizodia sp. TS-e1964]